MLADAQKWFEEHGHELPTDGTDMYFGDFIMCTVGGHEDPVQAKKEFIERADFFELGLVELGEHIPSKREDLKQAQALLVDYLKKTRAFFLEKTKEVK